MSSSPHYKKQFEPGTTFKEEGGKFILKPQALDITWGGDSRYWRIPDKSSQEPVELLQVYWLQVSGSMELKKLNAGQDYMVSFKLSMKPDAFGWTASPVYLMAKPGKRGKYNWKSVDLSSRRAGDVFLVPRDPMLKFTAPSPTEMVEGDQLHFGIYEIWKGKWKGGLVIHEVIIEPFNASPSA